MLGRRSGAALNSLSDVHYYPFTPEETEAPEVKKRDPGYEAQRGKARTQALHLTPNPGSQVPEGASLTDGSLVWGQRPVSGLRVQPTQVL